MSISKLAHTSTIVVFAYAPAGLGHLRVTNALYAGLPKGVSPLLLGAQDKRITYIHRIMSVHSITRALFEWLERGWAEEITTPLYRWFLQKNSDVLYKQLVTILDQHIHIPKTILIVATHFGLAHQATYIKKHLINKRNVQVKVVVQVTDDSPHHIWYVPHADLIVVPSIHTQRKLLSYGKRFQLPAAPIEVNPYPLHPAFNTKMPQAHKQQRIKQFDPRSTSRIHIAFPVAGAAVGTDFMKNTIDELHRLSQRFFAHVVSKQAPFTSAFLYEMSRRSYVKVYASHSDKQVISMYEKLYSKQIIGIEVTKPSEQAFKALISPDKQGGSLLFFSDPVGRQEYDNLDFLRRHHLLPSERMQQSLWSYAQNNVLDTTKDIENLKQHAQHWRCLQLPHNASDAARSIWWCLQIGILSSMQSCRNMDTARNIQDYVLRPDGVDTFWKKTAALLP